MTDILKILLEVVVIPAVVNGLAWAFAWGRFTARTEARMQELERWRDEHKQNSRDQEERVTDIRLLAERQQEINRSTLQSIQRIETTLRNDLREGLRDLGERLERIDRGRHPGRE